MTGWQRKHILLAGLLLILLANAVALLGVAYNRSGQAESQIVLTQRELESPSWWRYGAEDSSLSLRLRWRVLSSDEGGHRQVWPTYYYGSPDWLDDQKLREFGFDLPATKDERRYSYRERQREVLLVLEHNGPAYQQALQRAREFLAREQAVFDAMPGNKEFERRLKTAQESLAREEHENSRLFVVDAGLDAATLRTKYPARDRYLILTGRITPLYRRSDRSLADQWGGYISGIQNERVNVPLELRAIFDSARTVNKPGSVNGAPFEAIVAFGRRHEPWLVSATAIAEARQ
jgi:hypothetical protein